MMEDLIVARRLRQRKTRICLGFTLTELLVVVSIIPILLSIAIPSLNRKRQLAREAICASNLKQIGIASLSYEQDYQRLPMHYTENDGKALPDGTTAPLRCWPDMVANNFSVDTRTQWVSYINDTKFFNCPMVKTLNYDLDVVPLNSCRIYGGYQFLMGYFRDRSADKIWGARWTKTTQNWNYEGLRMNVLAGDRMYYSKSMGHYRINHGAGSGLSLIYKPYSSTTSTSWIGSMYEGYGVLGEDLRLKTNSAYVFTDGSVGKFEGDDERLVSITTPSDQDSNMGTILMPSN